MGVRSVLRTARLTLALLVEKAEVANKTRIASEITGVPIALKQYHAHDGTWEARFGATEHEEVRRLTEGVITFFKRYAGPNYLEFTVYAEDLGPIVVTFQRARGETPHQRREAAERERDALRAAVLDARDALTTILQHAPGYDWNADPLYLTRRSGDVFATIAEVLGEGGSRGS